MFCSCCFRSPAVLMQRLLVSYWYPPTNPVSSLAVSMVFSKKNTSAAPAFLPSLHLHCKRLTGQG
eukprot:c29464_g1_i1 orf=3-194(-)